MKTILLAALLAGGLFADSVDQQTTVTGIAGTADQAVTCVLSTPAKPAVHAVCSIGTAVVLTQDATPAVGAMNGVSASFSSSGNTVTFIVQQPTAGVLTYQMAAGTANRSGNL